MNKINNTSLGLKNKGQKVILYGFVANKRQIGNIIFVDLRDRSGIIQIVLRKKFDNFFKESVLKVEGTIIERKQKNLKIKTGNIEVEVENLTILSQAINELPFVIRNDLEANEDTRLKHRYLDLRRPIMQEIIKIRYKVVKAIRDFLDNNDFYEIETPLLSKSTPEGARDFLVPTRKQHKFFALPQSPQIYKQLLMISGFEKYFQIVKVFRDEDSRKDRQPEFTQLDIEISYENEKTLKKLIEDMFVFIFKKLGIKLKTPFVRMDYNFALENYGLDKPDTRYLFLLKDVKLYFLNTNFNIFKKANAIKMIAFNKFLLKKDIELLKKEAQKNGAKNLIFVTLKNKKLNGLGAKFFPIESRRLFKENSLNEGTLLFVADQKKIVNQALGSIRIMLNEMFNLAKDEYNFIWIENWPLYEIDEKTNKFISTHHIFTSPTKKWLKNFDDDKKNAISSHYDLVLNGCELGSGSVRINDIEIQKRMFSANDLSTQEQNSKFGFFLESFKYGIPPHLGIALGIDRLIMILKKTKSIRDVIAFPKNPSYISVMENSPSKINDNLKEYYLKKI